MSCDTGANRTAAAAACGISRLASKRSFYLGLAAAGVISGLVLGRKRLARATARHRFRLRRLYRRLVSPAAPALVDPRQVPEMTGRETVRATPRDRLRDKCAECGSSPNAKPGAWYVIGGRPYCQDCAPAGAGAARASGVPAAGSRVGHAFGSLMDGVYTTLYRGMAKAAGASDAVLDVVDRRGLAARLSRSNAVKAVVAGAAMEELGRRKAARGGLDRDSLEQVPGGAYAAIGLGEALPAAATATAVHQVSTHLGSLAGRATRQEEVGMVSQRRPVTLAGLTLGEASEKVSLWRTRLTGTLNALDAPIPGRMRGVLHSDGVLFKTGDTSWHRGTLRVDTPKGERMLTHLQSLNLPASHYYFNCALSDEQAVGIAAGRLRADHLPGYVGQVSTLESLSLAWGAAKHAMIKNVIYFGHSKDRA